MFQYFIKGLDSKMQSTLAMMYRNSCCVDEINHRCEMEEMERRITEKVMQNISIRIENEATKQLHDMLNNLGN